ncbi:hypothetical protein N7467_000333 [Penicillium canescens]|nr:hypothetical protein N7467_000333 [Penicillium canescens]
MAGHTTPNLAVLIDADNAMPSKTKSLLAEVAKYGTAHVKRAYGDWTSTNLNGWKKSFSYGRSSRCSSLPMIIDAMDLLYQKHLDGFCLVSSDSDFTRLAARIRESGLTVYGFGEQKTPKPFVSACDKFIYTENLVYHEELMPHPDRVIVPKNHASVRQARADDHLISLLHTTVETVSDDNGWAPLSRIGFILTERHPDFDSRTYGYSKLSDLISTLPLFDVIRHSPGKGKPNVIYVRDKQRKGKNRAN